MRVLHYCQHVLGIGHFFRSMEIAKAFRPHRVTFVEGGTPLTGYEPPEHITRVFLPALMMDPQFRSFETEEEDLESLKERRREKLLETYRQTRPDVLLIELFPFGRKKFRFELIPLLEENLSRSPGAQVVCSVRDILVEKTDTAAYEEKVLKVLNRYFDLVLVHGDPDMIPLSATFSRTAHIRPPVVHTGYVLRSLPSPPPEKIPGRVVVSTGGGRVGWELLEAVWRAWNLLGRSDLHLHIYQGPFMEDQDRRRIQEWAARDPRLALRPFALDFTARMAEAELSISMAGYNTCMDILVTGTRALVFPFPQNREQALRADALEERGVVRVLRSLDPKDVAQAIEQELSSNPPPRHLPRCDGARETVRAIENLAPRH
ncbi:Predicted glycosyl transferase [Desulfacinum hydrothermale DSM 13146]|uniref:Predicted glycosyl transferase n=1 Tax=Desulfacinum hydrothermale DSM 13146 TaxID=1121390 RepID=A0A1W1XSP8_9BACT|nr:glycosyltransferase [Desulfacinum hydrothermale]SMC26983.1 Predicted glycosyl transferase [Desulfacinum hydrothermale DSM 13146]